MATSAQTLEVIIATLSTKYKFDKGEAIALLAKEELLPKKMIPKVEKCDSPFASKKAEELAASLHLTISDCTGSGKGGKWTLADVEKYAQKPAKTKLLVSPNALNLANDNSLSLVGRVGTGKDGRILLQDVEGWIAGSEEEDEDLNISPRALQEAHEAGIEDDELEAIVGSGKDGRILLADIKKHISESEGESPKKGKKAVRAKASASSDDESDDDED